MKRLDIYEHEIIKDDLIYFVALLLSIKTFDRNAKEIKQFSYKNEKYPFAVLWAMEWLYSQDALKNYTIHVPVSGFPEKDFAGNKMPPSSYRRSTGFENYGMVPEYIGRLLNRYPDSIDKSYCSFYVDVSHEKLETLLKKNTEYFKACGNIYTSEYSYEKQLTVLVDFIRDKYKNNGNFHQIRIELNNPNLKEIDIVRTVSTLHFEHIKQSKKKDLKYEEKLINVFDSVNKREKWVDGLDETTIYFRLSDYFIKKYLLKTKSKQPLYKKIEVEKPIPEKPDEIYEFEGLVLNLTYHTLTYLNNTIPVSDDNGIKLLKLLMIKPNQLHQYKNILASFDGIEVASNEITNGYAGNVINQGSKSAFPKLKNYFKRVEADKIIEQIKTTRGKGLRLVSSANI